VTFFQVSHKKFVVIFAVTTGDQCPQTPVEVDDIAIIYKSFNLDVPNDL
jgi:hypothetical protein